MNKLNSHWGILWSCVMAAVLGLALIGCSQKQVLEKITSPEDRSFGQAVVSDLEEGPNGDADLLGRLDPGLRNKLTAVLPKMRSALPNALKSQSQLVDGSVNVIMANGSATRTTYLAYEVDASRKSALVRVQFVRQGGAAPRITTLYVNELEAPVARLNSFSLAGKSATQYAVLILAVLSFLTIVASEIALVATKRVPLKWLWFLGCLFGYGQVWVDWSSGGLAFVPINIQLLGAFALKNGLLAPWRVGFGVPVVSIIFLILRRRLRKPAPTAAEPAAAFS